jgi:hypothetical protein
MLRSAKHPFGLSRQGTMPHCANATWRNPAESGSILPYPGALVNIPKSWIKKHLPYPKMINVYIYICKNVCSYIFNSIPFWIFWGSSPATASPDLSHSCSTARLPRRPPCRVCNWHRVIDSSRGRRSPAQVSSVSSGVSDAPLSKKTLSSICASARFHTWVKNGKRKSQIDRSHSYMANLEFGPLKNQQNSWLVKDQRSEL